MCALGSQKTQVNRKWDSQSDYRENDTENCNDMSWEE